MGNRFVGIPFIFTDLYDLPALQRINVLDKSLTKAPFLRVLPSHLVYKSQSKWPPPPPLNRMNKSRKNMKKVRTSIGSLYPPQKYVLRVCFAPQNTSAPGHFVAPLRTSPPKNKKQKQKQKKMSTPGDGQRYHVMVIIHFSSGIENYLTNMVR